MTTANFPPPSDPSLYPPGVAARPGPAPLPEPPLSVGALLRTLRAGRWLILGAGAVAFATVALVVVLLPRTYTSTATFVLHGSKGGGNLAGLASQFGVSVSGANVWQQPNFYGELLQSREVLESVANDSFCEPCTPRSPRRPLAELLEVAEPDSLRRSAAVVGKVRRMVNGLVSPRTGLVTLQVTSEGPALAQQIAARFLAELSRFNIEAQRSQASAERQFADQRMQDVAGQLRAAELRLENFYSNNRSYANSPELRFREARLERDVALLQGLYTSLATAYEQARIDERRDLPVMMVVDEASLPPYPDDRKLELKSALGGVLGLLVGAAVVLLRARGGSGSRRRA